MTLFKSRKKVVEDMEARMAQEPIVRTPRNRPGGAFARTSWRCWAWAC